MADAPLPDLAPTCTDGVKNGDETDIDCGGGTCEACKKGDPSDRWCAHPV